MSPSWCVLMEWNYTLWVVCEARPVLKSFAIFLTIEGVFSFLHKSILKCRTEDLDCGLHTIFLMRMSLI